MELRTIYFGLADLPGWAYLLTTLGLTHVTIAAVTIFLHRHQAHRALNLHPLASHFFRFWLWLTTGMSTKEWVAVHRKHHAAVETSEDPHSPRSTALADCFRPAYFYMSEKRRIARRSGSMEQELSALWSRSSASTEDLLMQMSAWRRRAEASGNLAVREFARRLVHLIE